MAAVLRQSTDRGSWIIIQQNATDQEMQELELSLASLYDDMEDKIIATNAILELTKNLDCLAAIASHDSAMCALARVLKEEGRKCFLLRLNIVSVFFVFSFFRNFHQVLLSQNIGRSTLQILALEAQRIEVQIVQKGASCRFLSSSIEANLKESFIHNAERERILYTTIRLLFNLAQDVHIEEKMKKCFLVEHLCGVLDFQNAQLHVIVLTFLKKLSVYKENKDTMKEVGIISKVARIFPTCDELLLVTALGLLWNLSFDPFLRSEMVDCTLLPILDGLLSQQKYRRLASGILYNISCDNVLRTCFEEAKIMQTLSQIIFAGPTKDAPEEMIALLINLTSVPSIAESYCKPFVIEKLLSRAKSLSELLIFKVLRNLSRAKEGKMLLACFIVDLVNILLEANETIQVEVMGTLNNLTSCLEDSFDFIYKKSNLLQFLSNRLQHGSVGSDLTLEICIFVGDICSHRTATIVSQVGLVSKLTAIFLEKFRDADLTVQLMYTYSRFLLYESTRRDLFALLEKIMGRVLKLLKVSNMVVANMADIFVNAIMDVDEDYSEKLKLLRFSLCNQESMNFVEKYDK